MSEIARLIIEQGRAAAEARAASGQVWGQAMTRISQIPAQVQQQQRSQQELDMQRAELQQRLALQGQQFQMGQQAQQDIKTTDALWSDPQIYAPDGSVNREGLRTRLAAANAGHLVPHVMAIADTLDEGRSKIQEAHQRLFSEQNEILGRAALKIDAADHDPGAFHLAVSSLAKPDVGVIPPDQANQWLNQVRTPADVAAVTKQWKAGTRSGEADVMVVPEGGVPLDKRTGQPLPGFTPTPKPKDEFQTFKESYPGMLGLKSWEQLNPKQKTDALGVYAESKADPAMRAVAMSNAELAGAMKRLQIGQQPTPEDAEATAETILKHQLAPSQMASMFGGFGGAAFKRMVGTAAMKKDPNFDWEQAESDYQFGKSPGFQTTVRLMGSIQESLPRLQQTADQLANTNVRFINGIKNLTKDQLNNPTLKAFQTDALFVADEAAKILQGGGTGNATSDQKLTQAQKVFRDSDSPAAIAAAAKEVDTLIGYRRKTLTRGTYVDRQAPAPAQAAGAPGAGASPTAPAPRMYYDMNGKPISAPAK